MTRWLRRPAEGGFTIVETAMAGILAVIVFTGLAGSLTAALREARENRYQQTATAVALTELEEVRALEWAALAMTSVDGDAPLLAANGIQLDGAAVGLPRDETLAVADDGAVEPSSVETVDGTSYTVWRYVTMPDYDSRRLVFEIVWQNESGTHHHLTSVMITKATGEQLVVGGA